MFLLRFDVLFTGFDAAREAARKLSALLGTPQPPANPREHKRMQEELQLAREKVRMQSMPGRQTFL